MSCPRYRVSLEGDWTFRAAHRRLEESCRSEPHAGSLCRGRSEQRAAHACWHLGAPKHHGVRAHEGRSFLSRQMAVGDRGRHGERSHVAQGPCHPESHPTCTLGMSDPGMAPAGTGRGPPTLLVLHDFAGLPLSSRWAGGSRWEPVPSIQTCLGESKSSERPAPADGEA